MTGKQSIAIQCLKRKKSILAKKLKCPEMHSRWCLTIRCAT